MGKKEENKRKIFIKGENLTSFKKNLIKALAIALVERADSSLVYHVFSITEARRKKNASSFHMFFDEELSDLARAWAFYLRYLGFLDIPEILDLLQQLYGILLKEKTVFTV